eukprot:TRINITY_DN813_c0_g1_i1.p1 TRINITY_DN813_c0_g1~~TRINITY_DN813_c0_g1_i1.p1  ORF type:complete len:377 (-),score=93.86 TRINITY_DN813_c0_g1_i1:195-1325(-)
MGKPKAKARRGVAKPGAGSSTANTSKPQATKYNINDILDKAEECLDEYKYELAQKFCERALQIDNDNVRALELTSGLLLDMGQVESAQHCLGRAIYLQPDEGHSKYLSLAQIMAGAESRDLYRKGIELITSKLGTLSSPDEGGELRRDLSNALVSISEIYMTDLCDEPEAEQESKSCIERSVEADNTNPEAYQAQANYALVTGQTEIAKSAINKSLDLWLPDQIKFLEDGTGKETSLSYTFRTATVKILLDLEDFENAVKILDSLLEEDDEVVATWYLLGWTNYLRSKNENEYLGNARFYLNKALEVNKKASTDDAQMLEHIKTLLEELGEEQETQEDASVNIADLEDETAANILDSEARTGEENSNGDNEEMMED